MSGIFGNVAPIQTPDLGATLARAQGMQANRLAMLAQQRQMEQQDALQGFFAQNGAGFASPDAGKRMNLLAMLAAQPGGAQMALPMLNEQRFQGQLEQIMGGGAPASAPASAPAPAGPHPGDASLPRGLRNNNPLNLSYVQGQPGVQGSDGRFGRYATPEEGIAASVRQLQMYGQRGLTTPAQIIGRWAPPGENNTGAYIAAVARNAGLDPNQPINMSDPAVMTRLVGAMGEHENGRPLDPAVVQRGVQMGLGRGEGGDTVPTASGDTIPTQAASAPPSGAATGGDEERRQQQIRALLATGNPRAIQMAEIMSRMGAREAVRWVEQRRADGVFMVDPTNPTRQVRMGDAPESAPRSPQRFEQDRELAREGAARSSTTVNAGDRRTDVLVADAWKASEDTAVAAGRRAALFNRAEQAFERFQPGALAERRIWLGQMARELGIRSPSTSEGEVLQQVQRQLELATTPSGQGAITENERGLIRQAIPVLLSTPEGARQAISLIRRLDDYEMQIARIYREDARANGGQPNAVSVREKIADFIAQNQPPDVQAVIENLSGPTQGGSGVQADPPAGIPALPRGFRIMQ